jgi:hypothetical protein
MDVIKCYSVSSDSESESESESEESTSAFESVIVRGGSESSVAGNGFEFEQCGMTLLDNNEDSNCSSGVGAWDIHTPPTLETKQRKSNPQWIFLQEFQTLEEFTVWRKRTSPINWNIGTKSNVKVEGGSYSYYNFVCKTHHFCPAQVYTTLYTTEYTKSYIYISIKLCS